MKHILFAMIMAFCPPIALSAQIEQGQKEFDDFVKQQQKEFNDFVNEQNKEFAKFLKETWKEYSLQKSVLRPRRPEPTKPINFDHNKPQGKPQEVKVAEVTITPIQEVTPNAGFPSSFQKIPVPVIPGANVPSSAIMTQTGIEFTFYGINCVVNSSMKNRLSLKGISEKEVAEGWETLSHYDYEPLINDCLATKKKNNLNDYGYLLLTRKVATDLCGSNYTNEIALMQTFILSQSGYLVKIVRMDNWLTLFYASRNQIYNTTFTSINGMNYYRADTVTSKSNSIYTYNCDFAIATHPVSMNITFPLVFNGSYVKKTLQAKAHPSVRVHSHVSSELTSFYKDYPQCDFSVYVGAPVSQELQQKILPPLQAAIQGKKQSEAANILINFAQTAFDYKTDSDQFGYEKTFFVDELFYYPYSDCEDRAILYSYLVRTLMGLDVVLLEYPNHIATAVCFNEEVNGDYVTVSGKKYIICDPTYIGASIGLTMPQFKSVAAKVLKY